MIDEERQEAVDAIAERDQSLAAAKREIERLKAVARQHEEDCACLPEDMSVTETVTALRQQVHDLRAVVEKYRTAARPAVEVLDNCGCEVEAGRLQNAINFDSATLGGQQGQTEKGGQGVER